MGSAWASPPYASMPSPSAAPRLDTAYQPLPLREGRKASERSEEDFGEGCSQPALLPTRIFREDRGQTEIICLLSSAVLEPATSGRAVLVSGCTVIIALAVLLLSASVVNAQTVRLRGTVLDPSGAVIPGAAVKVSQGNRVIMEGQSDSTGNFSFDLAVGDEAAPFAARSAAAPAGGGEGPRGGRR